MSTYDNEADNPEQREDRREGNILGATPGPYDDTEQAEKDSRFAPRPTPEGADDNELTPEQAAEERARLAEHPDERVAPSAELEAARVSQEVADDAPHSLPADATTEEFTEATTPDDSQGTAPVDVDEVVIVRDADTGRIVESSAFTGPPLLEDHRAAEALPAVPPDARQARGRPGQGGRRDRPQPVAGGDRRSGG